MCIKKELSNRLTQFDNSFFVVYRWPDSNRQASRHRILSAACLPIPPHRQNDMGRSKGIEPSSVGATIRCVNHFATTAIFIAQQNLNLAYFRHVLQQGKYTNNIFRDSLVFYFIEKAFSALLSSFLSSL